MLLPYLKDPGYRRQKEIIDFRGVNYSENVREGQLEESRNLFSGRFPCMSPREGREVQGSYDNATAVWYKDGQLVVDGTNLIYNGEVVGVVSPGQKQIANVNSKVVIMPDKVVFDTKTREMRGLGAEYTTVAGTAKFESDDTKSRLLTHIGTYVDGVVGSGNVGGNDVLGKSSPTFCDEAAPFSAVYESGSVNADSGALVFGAAKSKTVRDVTVGDAFVESGLGADGATRFGRVTGKTKFDVEGLPAGNGPYYAWNRYQKTDGKVMTKTVGYGGQTYEHGVFTGFSHSVVEGFSCGNASADLRLWTKSGNGTLKVALGTGVTVGEDGYWVFENESRVSYDFQYDEEIGGGPTATAYVGPLKFSNGSVGYRYAFLYIGLVEDGHITTYLEMKVQIKNDEDNGTTNFRVLFRTGRDTVKDVDHFCVRLEYAPELDPYGNATLCYSDGPAYAKGAANGMVFGSVAGDYPQDGYRDGYFYTYRGVYDDPAYYGFDYDLIAANDGGGEHGFEKANFRKGDAVEISGCASLSGNNISAVIREIGQEDVDGLTMHYLQFDGGLFTTGTETSAVTIRRKVPNLSVIAESNNRLWGAEGNTIYASALGDPTNFFTYDGLDTDSYAVTVASEGAFTGCCGFGNSVLFFKEDRLMKVLGSYPSQYTMYEYQVPGVLSGSEGSLWNINEVLYYHSREGVYRYNGGSPELISENFGLRRFQNASAGAAGDRYYISMQDRETGDWGLWAYDILRGIWLQEDETQAVCFARDGGKLYFIDGADGSLVLVNPDSSEEEIEWSATLCRMDEVYHDRKCYSRLLLRADLEEGAWLKVEVACDDGPFDTVSVTHKDRKLAVIPIHPNRCANFRVRLSGGGKVIVRSLVREMDILGEY